MQVPNVLSDTSGQNAWRREHVQITTLNDLCSMDRNEQSLLLDLMEMMCLKIWSGSVIKPLPEMRDAIFREGMYIRLACIDSECIGFAIRRRFIINDIDVLYHWRTAISPHAQGLGIYGDFIRRDTVDLLGSPFERRSQVTRTRNPLVWHRISSLCGAQAYDIETGATDREVQSFGAMVAKFLFPNNAFSLDTMTCHSAYTPGVGYLRMPAHENAKFNRAFYSHPALLTPSDAPLFVGYLKSSEELKWFTNRS